MNPPAPAARLRHIPVRLRVTVDPEVWGKTGKDLAADVRDFCVEHIREAGPLIVAVRRDGA